MNQGGETVTHGFVRPDGGEDVTGYAQFVVQDNFPLPGSDRGILIIYHVDSQGSRIGEMIQIPVKLLVQA